MPMEKIRWCAGKKGGIELVEPNGDLSRAYMLKAEASLQAMASLKGNRPWEISTSYYSMYFGVYSIMMKMGVKCEIHSCTIEFMKRFLGSLFSRDECKLLSDSMDARVDSQYYVDRKVSDEQYRRMLKESPSFVAKCRSILSRLSDSDIEATRNALKKAIT